MKKSLIKHLQIKRIISLILAVILILSTGYFAFVAAEPAVEGLTGYTKVFTSQGKPIWVKLSLPSGGSIVNLPAGSSVTLRLDYCFDKNLKPVAGDSLQLYISGFPNGIFILPSNMHTSGNYYSGGVIRLNFADVGGYKLEDGLTGWMTVSFYASGDATPGTYTPQIIGQGSIENTIKIEQIIVPAPGDPGPPGSGGNGYILIGKLSEHVLYPVQGGYLADFYKYQVPVAPAYISYEIILNDGGGELWAKNHIGDFDYLVFTDTLGPGQEFVVNNGEPWNGINNTSGTYTDYKGLAPFYSIALWRKDPTTGNIITDPDPLKVVSNTSIDKTDKNKDYVNVEISPDKKTVTLTIKKGAFIANKISTVDNLTSIRLDYYVKVTDPEVTSFTNSAKIEYVKNGEVIGGDSGIHIDVIKQSGADFIVKEVGKWGCTLGDISGWGSHGDNYFSSTNKGLHGPENPLIVNNGDLLIYSIKYQNTGDRAKTAGEVVILDKLPAELELVQLREWGNIYTHDSNGFNLNYNSVSHEITLTNSGTLAIGTDYWVTFIVRVKNTAESGQPILNEVGSNITVVKKDGYAIQLYKYGLEDSMPLKNVEFNLYKYENNAYVLISPVLKTDNSGYTDVKNLAPGQYKLVETKAPEDYPAVDPLNPLIIEFEIFPESSGIKGINKISVINSPGNMANPIDEDGVAIFSIPNEKTPVGTISVVKELPDGKIRDTDDFYVTLTNDDGDYLQFNNSGEYIGLDITVCKIKINDEIPVFLKKIPINLGPLTLTETNDSIKEYNVTYMVDGFETSDIYLNLTNKSAFVTVTNHKPVITDINGKIKILKSSVANSSGNIDFTGVKFDLFKITGDVKTFIQTLTIGGGNYSEISDELAPGDYVLIEKDAIEGFEDNNGLEIEFTVLTNGSVMLDGNIITPDGYVLIEVLNTPDEIIIPDKYNFEFKKVGKNNDANGLKGVKFGLYENPACTLLLQEAESDDYGIVLFENLDEKTYYMKEISTPIEYKLAETVYTVIVSAATTINGAETNVNNLYTITNGLKPVVTSITVTKVWLDDDEITRPDSITVKLLQNGVEINSQTQSAPWIFDAWNDLPVYSDENHNILYVYTIEEAPVNNYITTIDGFTVTNEYKPGIANAVINGTKIITGITGTDRIFTFNAVQVKELNSEELVPEGKSGTASTVGADDFIINITGLVPAEYYFMVTEDLTNSGTDGWVYDGSKFWVKIIVTDDGDGGADAVVYYDENNETGILFENNYTPEEPPEPKFYSAIINGNKIVTGTSVTGRLFTFNLEEVTEENGNILKSEGYKDSVTVASGDFSFTIENLSLGEYYFRITENQTGNGGSWSYDNHAFWVTLTVTENGVAAKYQGLSTFINRYTPPQPPGGYGDDDDDDDDNIPTTTPTPTPLPNPPPPVGDDDDDDDDDQPEIEQPGDDDDDQPGNEIFDQGDDDDDELETEPSTEPYIEPPTEPEIIDENEEIYEEEDMGDGRIPLRNGWFAIDLGDNLYEIFDENGVPLGYVQLEDGEDIEDWEDYDRLIPLWGLNPVEIPEPTEDEAPRVNPKTRDTLACIMLSMLSLTTAGTIIKKRKIIMK